MDKSRTVQLLILVQFSMDTSVLVTGKYRKLVFTGEICRPCPVSSGPEILPKIFFPHPLAPDKVSNQTVPLDPTVGSQTHCLL